MQPQGHLQATPGNTFLRGSKFRGAQGLGIVYVSSISQVKNAWFGALHCEGFVWLWGGITVESISSKNGQGVLGSPGQQCVTGPAQKSRNIIAPLIRLRSAGLRDFPLCLFH